MTATTSTELTALVQYIPLLIPLLLLQLGLQIYCIIRAAKMELSTGHRVLWILVILFFNLLGSIIFLLVARPETHDEGKGS